MKIDSSADVIRHLAKRENKKLKDQIKKKLAKGKGIAQIADEIEESEETVLELIKQIEAEKQVI